MIATVSLGAESAIPDSSGVVGATSIPDLPAGIDTGTYVLPGFDWGAMTKLDGSQTVHWRPAPLTWNRIYA